MKEATVNIPPLIQSTEKRFKEDDRQHDKKGDNKDPGKSNQPQSAGRDKCAGNVHRHATPVKNNL